MSNYKQTFEDQTVFIQLSALNQFQVESFEFAIHYLLEKKIDLSRFQNRIKNHSGGAPAYHPKILLKIILMAYSMGITSSRTIDKLCIDNTTFMVLSGFNQPKKSKIAEFVSQLSNEIESIFVQVLSVCYEMDLIGNQMFAIDGCKLPSNASKEWSGTRNDFLKKKGKLEKAIRFIIKKHQDEDTEHIAPDRYQAEQKQKDKLIKVCQKHKSFLKENKDKPGKRKKVVQSNITDNESAKMKTHNGIQQGFNAVTVSDGKKQVIIAAEIFGSADERPTLKPLVEQIRKNMNPLIKEDDIFEIAKLLADAGFTSEDTLKYLTQEKIDAYFADAEMRKRDPRFKDAKKNHSIRPKKSKKFTKEDFYYDPDNQTCICPTGKYMWLKSSNAKMGCYLTVRFEGHAKVCRNCESRKQCLQKETQKYARQIAWKKEESNYLSYTEQMREKIDSDQGKSIYNKRLGMIEPVFANITSTKKLNRLSFRGKEKNNTQWKLFCVVHNIGKIMKYGDLSA